MGDIAIGATVFQREEKIANLLDSIRDDLPIKTVYIGDNGKFTNRKEEIYNKDYPFDLEVLDLDYDSGLGYSRRKIFDHSDEQYLLIVDSDVEIPHNVMELQTILKHRPDLGGVGGILIEDDRIRSDCYDLFEEGPLLMKDIKRPKQVQEVAGLPLVEFDQIQNVAMYRRECLEDYCWDPEYRIGWEHTDFFYGHKTQTEWSFGVCPEVMFRHYPGGDEAYLSKRRNHNRLWKSKQYFLNKWGFQQMIYGQTRWLGSHGGMPKVRSDIQNIMKKLLLTLPDTAKQLLMAVRDYKRRVNNEPPF